MAAEAPSIRLLAGLDPALRSAWAGAAGLDERLTELIAAARATWPGVVVPDERFLAYLAERLPAAATALQAVASVDGVELYLTCACGQGDRAALLAFERVYLAGVPAALARMHLGASTVDEIVQILRQRLLVADDGGPPKLDAYAGRGDLRGLLRVAAVRIAIGMLRKQAREAPAPDEELLRLPAGGDDPALQYLKQHHRAAFKVAFQESVAALSSRDRTLLRLHLLDGLPVGQLATLYRVHRATATRWLAASRTFLLGETRRRLKASLAIDGDELSDLVALIQSRLDLSLSRVLISDS